MVVVHSGGGGGGGCGGRVVGSRGVVAAVVVIALHAHALTHAHVMPPAACMLHALTAALISAAAGRRLLCAMCHGLLNPAVPADSEEEAGRSVAALLHWHYWH